MVNYLNMFSIFHKKKFLVDYLSNITDFHNHILPGIDDGAKDLEDSLILLKGFEEIGITDIIATPHVIGEFYPNTPDTIRNAFNDVSKAADSKFNLGYSAEYMMDQHFVEIISEKQIIPLIENKVLVEMSYFQPPLNLNEILFKLQNNQYQPILAHPERYSYMHNKTVEKYRDLKIRGCKFQINMLSLSGHYGLGIQKMAFRLMEENLIDYISSDVHKIAHLDKIKEIKIPKKLETQIEKVSNNNRSLFQKIS